MQSPDDRQAMLLGIYSTILHETVHYGDYLDGIGFDDHEPGVAFVQDVLSIKVDGYKGWQMDDIHNKEDAKKIIQRKKDSVDMKYCLQCQGLIRRQRL
jgi:hypothetical protein